MPALAIAIITAVGLAVIFGLLIVDCVGHARYEAERRHRDAERFGSPT